MRGSNRNAAARLTPTTHKRNQKSPILCFFALAVILLLASHSSFAVDASVSDGDSDTGHDLVPFYNSHHSMLLLLRSDGHLTAVDVNTSATKWQTPTGGPLIKVEVVRPASGAVAATDPLAVPFTVKGDALHTHLPTAPYPDYYADEEAHVHPFHHYAHHGGQLASPTGSGALPSTDTSATSASAPPTYHFMSLPSLLRRRYVRSGQTDVFVTTSAAIIDVDSVSGDVLRAYAGGTDITSSHAHASQLRANAPILHVVRYSIVIRALRTDSYEWTITISQYEFTQLESNGERASPAHSPAPYLVEPVGDTHEESHHQRGKRRRFVSRWLGRLFRSEEDLLTQQRRRLHSGFASSTLGTRTDKFLVVTEKNRTHYSVSNVFSNRTLWCASLVNVITGAPCTVVEGDTIASGEQLAACPPVAAAFAWLDGEPVIGRLPVVRASAGTGSLVTSSTKARPSVLPLPLSSSPEDGSGISDSEEEAGLETLLEEERDLERYYSFHPDWAHDSGARLNANVGLDGVRQPFAYYPPPFMDPNYLLYHQNLYDYSVRRPPSLLQRTISKLPYKLIFAHLICLVVSAGCLGLGLFRRTYLLEAFEQTERLVASSYHQQQQQRDQKWARPLSKDALEPSSTGSFSRSSTTLTHSATSPSTSAPAEEYAAATVPTPHCPVTSFELLSSSSSTTSSGSSGADASDDDDEGTTTPTDDTVSTGEGDEDGDTNREYDTQTTSTTIEARAKPKQRRAKSTNGTSSSATAKSRGVNGRRSEKRLAHRFNGSTTQLRQRRLPSVHSIGEAEDDAGSPGAAGGALRSQGKVFQTMFQVREKVGFGGEGSVFRVVLRVTKMEYAVKVVRVDSETDPLVQEAVLHSSFDHPNVVRFFFCWLEELTERTVQSLAILNNDDGMDTLSVSNFSSPEVTATSSSAPSTVSRVNLLLFIQMEYFAKGTLADWLRDRDGFDNVENLRHVKDIATGLEYLHQQDVVHRDLKPTNVFVASNGTLKIGDFGLAKRRVNHAAAEAARGDSVVTVSITSPSITSPASVPGAVHDFSAACGSPLYCSPEQKDGRCAVNKPTDIFSLGVIAVELYCTFTTFHERHAILLAAKQQRLPPELEEEFPEEMALFHSMLSSDPSDRPTVGEVIQRLTQLIRKAEREESVSSAAEAPLARPKGRRHTSLSIPTSSGAVAAAAPASMGSAFPMFPAPLATASLTTARDAASSNAGGDGGGGSVHRSRCTSPSAADFEDFPQECLRASEVLEPYGLPSQRVHYSGDDDTDEFPSIVRDSVLGQGASHGMVQSSSAYDLTHTSPLRTATASEQW